MSKKAKTFIFIVAMIVVIILSWIGIRALDKHDEYDSSLCTICHQNKKIANADYCYSCYQKAQQRVEEKEKEAEKITSKKDSSSGTSTTSDDKNDSSAGSSAKPSSGSTKKEYNSLNYDPEDYDEYADDAWDEDFDSYDEAYEYWEDY